MVPLLALMTSNDRHSGLTFHIQSMYFSDAAFLTINYNNLNTHFYKHVISFCVQGPYYNLEIYH